MGRVMNLESVLKMRDCERPYILVLDESALIANNTRLYCLLKERLFDSEHLMGVVIPYKIRDKFINNGGNIIIGDIIRKIDDFDGCFSSPKYPIFYDKLAQYIMKYTGKNRIREMFLLRINRFINRVRMLAIEEIIAKYPNLDIEELTRITREDEEYARYFLGIDANEIKNKILGFNKDQIPKRENVDNEMRDILEHRSFGYNNLLYKQENGSLSDIFGIKQFLDSNCDKIKECNEEDINVLSSALYALRNTPRNTDVIIYADDIDFEEAVNALHLRTTYIRDALFKDFKGKRKRRGTLDRLGGELSRLKYIQALRIR